MVFVFIAVAALAGIGAGIGIGIIIGKNCFPKTVTKTVTELKPVEKIVEKTVEIERKKNSYTHEQVEEFFRATGIKSEVDFLQAYAVGFRDGLEKS